ncbi:MAG: hypothetical protein QMC93_03540, partial [Patescibacteria group bacterium]|nr:hypothetical protein [Patescibacteria group bacterium]
MKTAKTLILLALLGAGILFANNILAATEVADSPCNTTIVFNSPIPNQTYNVGDVINFSGKFRVTSCGDGLFHNKIEFFITEDKEIPIKNRNCCGDCCGAISNIYGGCIQNITWCGDVKILDIAQADGYKIYKLGTIYPPDIPTGFNPYWVPYDQYFTIPSDLGFWGPVRFYVQYSGTHWNAHWHWNITYQKGEINYPPHAAISCDPSDCGTTDCIAYTGCPFHLINNSTDPNGQADIIKSEWDIYNWGADPDLSCSGICNFTPQTLILTPGT